MYYIEYVMQASVPLPHASVYATHLEPQKHGVSNLAVSRFLNTAHSVICMNSDLKDRLRQLGVREQLLTVNVGAADPSIFVPHRRSSAKRGLIGFCTAYYERKNPDLMMEIIKRLPDQGFVLLGRGWAEYPRSSELLQLRNLTYLEVDYEEYPYWYGQMSVYVSTSYVEGGPIPLIETMMSNVVPVVSNTGFAKDVIRHGENGYIFEVDDPIERICEYICAALVSDFNVAESVSDLDWSGFTHRFAAAISAPDSGVTEKQ
jgi:glycosyltransferase involved in cell wall biosynthesis